MNAFKSPGGIRFTSSAPSSSAESDRVQHWDLTRRTYQSWGGEKVDDGMRLGRLSRGFNLTGYTLFLLLLTLMSCPRPKDKWPPWTMNTALVKLDAVTVRAAQRPHSLFPWELVLAVSSDLLLPVWTSSPLTWRSLHCPSNSVKY